MKRVTLALSLSFLVMALVGCGGKEGDAPTGDQTAKQKEGESQMQKAFESDPSLKKSGGSVTTPASTMPNPGPVPGGGR